MESPFNGLNYMQTPADEETAKNFDNSAQSSDVIFARTRLMFQPHKTAPRICVLMARLTKAGPNLSRVQVAVSGKFHPRAFLSYRKQEQTK